MVEFFKLALVHKSSQWYIQLLRYLFVAVAAFIVDFGGLIVLTEHAHLNYLVAATISFCAGVIINFALSVRWVFFDSKLAKRHHEFAAVLAIAGMGLAMNDALIWALTAGLGLYYVISKLIATAVVFFWNFFVRKWLLYSN